MKIVLWNIDYEIKNNKNDIILKIGLKNIFFIE